MGLFKIRSLHEIKTISSFTSRANIDFTVLTSYCNRSIDFRSDGPSPVVYEYGNNKSCEICLRNKGRESV